METVVQFIKHIQIEIAGVIGAAVSILWHRSEMKSGWDAVFYVAAGLACAHWVTPFLLEFQQIDPDYAGLVGFGVGTFSGSVIAFCYRFLKDDAPEVLKNLLGRLK